MAQISIISVSNGCPISFFHNCTIALFAFCHTLNYIIALRCYYLHFVSSLSLSLAHSHWACTNLYALCSMSFFRIFHYNSFVELIRHLFFLTLFSIFLVVVAVWFSKTLFLRHTIVDGICSLRCMNKLFPFLARSSILKHSFSLHNEYKFNTTDHSMLNGRKFMIHEILHFVSFRRFLASFLRCFCCCGFVSYFA